MANINDSDKIKAEGNVTSINDVKAVREKLAQEKKKEQEELMSHIVEQSKNELSEKENKKTEKEAEKKTNENSKEKNTEKEPVKKANSNGEKKPVKKSKNGKKKSSAAQKRHKNRKRTATFHKTVRRIKRASRIEMLIVGVVVLFVIAIGLYTVINKGNITIGDEQASFSQEYSMSSQAAFYGCGNSIFFCSKDGMALLSKKGETVWTDTFSMTSPVMLSDGEYTAVADKGAKIMNVYNLKGKVYTVTTEGNIITFAVNPQGFSVVMCKNNAESDYVAYGYSPDGQVAFKGSYVAKDGLPVGLDISDDGRIIGISFVNIAKINIKSKINFYFTNTEDAKTTDDSDAIFSGQEINDEMANSLHFMPDNSCIVSTDKKLYNIGGRNTSKNEYRQNWYIDYPNYVTAFNIVDNKFIAIAYGNPKEINVKDEYTNTVHWYNNSGFEIGSAEFDKPITAMYSNMESTIVAMGKVFVATDSRGKHLWDYTALQTINSVQFFGSTDRIILATANKMQLFNVKKGASMVEDNKDVDISQQENDKVEATTVAGQTTTAAPQTTTVAS